MDKDDLLLVPAEARGYQGNAAGVATRFAASAIDGVVICLWLLGMYLGYLALRLVLTPGAFHRPDHSLLLVGVAFFWTEVVYLALAWWIGGRTIGDRVMGVQVVPNRGGRLRFLQSVRTRLPVRSVPHRAAVVRGRPETSLTPGHRAADVGRLQLAPPTRR